MEQLCYNWKEFHEIKFWNIILKSVQKIQVLLKFENNNLHFTLRPLHIHDNYLAKVFLEWEIFQASFLEKVKTLI